MIKTKTEYRTQALKFAQKNGFDKVYFQGMIDDFEVYTCDFKTPSVIVLASGEFNHYESGENRQF